MKIQTAPEPVSGSLPVTPSTFLNESSCLSADAPVSMLVAQVFDTSCRLGRVRLLEHLLKPLGVLPLMAVANGIFMDMLFCGRSQALSIRPEDAQDVRVEDVIALVEQVEKVSIESIESLVPLFTADSLEPDSADAALLVNVLRQRTRVRHAQQSSARLFMEALA